MLRVGGLVIKAHRLLYHSTLGLRVIKKKNKKRVGFRLVPQPPPLTLFFITLGPRVIQPSTSLKYEPSSEPLHISAK